MPSRLRSPLVLAVMAAAVPLLARAGVGAAPSCPGDCSGDGVVAVEELMRAVQLALDVAPLDACPPADVNGDRRITVGELVTAVGAALEGCPPAAPSPTPTLTPSLTAAPSATPTPTATVNPDPIGRVFDALCSQDPWRRVELSPTLATLHREIPGHYADIRLRAYPTHAYAEGAFLAAAQAGEPVEFHGLPASYWEMAFPSLGGAHRDLVWRLGCWVIGAHSFDDTIYRLAPQVMPVSERIYADLGDELLGRCPDAPATPALGPDLMPSRIYASYGGGTANCRGPFGTLSVCVINAGNAPADAFGVAVAPAMALAFEPLAPGEERCLAQPLPFVDSFFTVRVDVGNAVTELDEDNNVLATSVHRPTIPATCTSSPGPTRTPTAPESRSPNGSPAPGLRAFAPSR